MNLYLSDGYIWTGTQKDAKAAVSEGGDFVAREVPTDKPALLVWLNEEWAKFIKQRVDEHIDEMEHIPNETTRAALDAADRGELTRVFMGSRDPAAPTICLSCGRTPHQQKVAVNCEGSMTIQAALADVTDPRSLDRIATLIEERRAQL